MSVNLSTTWLGLPLRNPLVASPSPLTGDLARLIELEDAGVAAAVLPSLFEEDVLAEELALEKHAQTGTDSFPEALSVFPELPDWKSRPDEYVRLLEDAKSRLEIPVIASLNGTSAGGWLEYATILETAGADALELNIYDLPTELDVSGAEMETRYIELVEQVTAAVNIPVAIKIGPYFSALPHMAGRFAKAGATGLVMFNRFMQPDMDIEALEVKPDVRLSTSWDLRLPLRWIAILKGRVDLSLGATSGLHRAEDVIKLIMAGADVTMMTSAFLRHGTGYPRVVLDSLVSWLEEHEYESVEQMKGSMSQLSCPDPHGFERANYMAALRGLAG